MSKSHLALPAVRLSPSSKALEIARRQQPAKRSRGAKPEAVILAKRLRRASPKSGERRSLRKVAALLATAGHVNEIGGQFNQKSIKRMVEGPGPEKTK